MKTPPFNRGFAISFFIGYVVMTFAGALIGYGPESMISFVLSGFMLSVLFGFVSGLYSQKGGGKKNG